MCCTISCCLCNGWMLFSDWRFANLCVMSAGRRCLPCHGGGFAATYLTNMLWHSSGIDDLKWSGDSIDSVGPCVMLMDLLVSRGSSWLIEMNRVTTYGNIGGPVELQRRVSPPSHCRFQRQTYTLECDLRERLIDQSSLIYRKRMWKKHIDARYMVFGSVLSAMIFILLQSFICHAHWCCSANEFLFVYTRCPKIL